MKYWPYLAFELMKQFPLFLQMYRKEVVALHFVILEYLLKDRRKSKARKKVRDKTFQLLSRYI